MDAVALLNAGQLKVALWTNLQNSRVAKKLKPMKIWWPLGSPPKNQREKRKPGDYNLLRIIQYSSWYFMQITEVRLTCGSHIKNSKLKRTLYYKIHPILLIDDDLWRSTQFKNSDLVGEYNHHRFHPAEQCNMYLVIFTYFQFSMYSSF